MASRISKWLPGVLIALLAMVPAVSSAEPSDDFATVRREVRLKARSARPEDRIAAIRRLAEFPLADAADLIVRTGLHGNDPAVRQAAYEALLDQSAHREVCGHLLARLRREVRSADPAVACALAAVLLDSELPEVQADLEELLDENVTTSRTGGVFLSLVATELAGQADARAVRSLEKLDGLKYFSANFGFRRGVVQAVLSIRRPEAVEAAIRLLGKLEGEARADIARYLSGLSGHHHGADADAWSKWWEENRDGFDFPPVAAPGVALAGADPDAGTYYGIPIYALRMVFVVDTSGSMNGPRLAAAKRELTETIRGLEPKQWFSIVVFSDEAKAWNRQLVQATPAVKQSAERFVGNLSAGGTTASYDALEAALSFDTEAIFFLSDGEPSAGKVVAPAAIVAFVRQANRHRRVSVYTIGVMPGPPGSPLATFMQALAEQNYAVYRQIDN